VPDKGIVLDHGKETLQTTMLDAIPDVIVKMPKDSLLPVLLALALSSMFAALMIEAWWFLGATILVSLAIVLAWLWPSRELGQLRGGAP
jgi:hypothetical protein